MRVRISIIEGPDAGKHMVLDRRDSALVGRSPQAPLCLSGDGRASAFHAVIDFSPPAVVVRDLGTAEGTFVNGSSERISSFELASGDRVRIGESVLLVELREDHALALEATELGESEALPPPTERLVTLRCRGCGERTEHRVPAAESGGAACFCQACKAELEGAPPPLPGYRLVRELGRGGMGVVYLAEHAEHGQRVLKVMLPEAAVREHNRRLFLREASKQAGLRHPNVVELFALEEPAPGVFVAVLEYVPGESCDRLLERHPNGLALGLAAQIVAEALSGLSFIHDKGLVHRDIKESNLLMARGGSVKIADFGLAKSYDESGASALTRPGQVGGTAPYMPPEQIRQFRDVRPPADLYAAGATLYRLLTGAFPHEFPEGRHPFQVVLVDPIIPLDRRRPGLPRAVAQVIERAMAKEPADRFSSAAEMREALLGAAGAG